MEGRGRQPGMLVLTVIMAILMIPTIVSGTSSTRAPGDATYTEPEISIEFESSSYVIDPHPVDGGHVYITGRLICDIPESVPSNIYCEINLVPISQHAVSMETEPYTFNKLFEEQDIILDVKVVSELKGDTTIPLDLEARWEYPVTRQGGNLLFHTNLTMPPHGYVNGSMPLSLETLDMKIEKWESTIIDIHNNVNMDGEFELEIVNAPSNLEIDLTDDTFIINAHQRATIPIGFKQTSGSGQRSVITIGIKSDLPGDLSYTEFDVVVETKDDDEGGATWTFYVLIGLFILVLISMIAKVVMNKRRINE